MINVDDDDGSATSRTAAAAAAHDVTDWPATAAISSQADFDDDDRRPRPAVGFGNWSPHYCQVEHSNSGQKSYDSIRFDSRYRIDFFRFGNLINLPLVH